MEKSCRKCGIVKPLTEFYAHSTSADGYRGDCKQCHLAAHLSRYYARHEDSKRKKRERHAAKMADNPNWHAEYYAKNRERMLAASKLEYKKRRKERIANAVAWAKANKGKANANKKAYKAAKAKACPVWVREDVELLWLMQQAYELAAQRTEVFGFQWHVDHVVPLRGAQVCGLHTPWNLQVIPGSENCSKSNKYSME